MQVNDVKWIVGFVNEETGWRYQVALFGYLYSAADSLDVVDNAVI